MSVFAIGDTHLSFGSDKPMNVFRGWDNYVERLKENWENLIGEDDTVVIMGDVSWAMSLDGALEDFRFIDGLPGRKIILKGNHDYWWNTLTKMNAFLEQHSINSISFLYNNAYLVEGMCICGTRGWFFDAETEDSDRIIAREAGRLRASIEAGRQLGGEPIVFLHYPPITKTDVCQPIVDVLRQQGIKRCYYAHLHASSVYNSFNGEQDSIRYELLSADYLKFYPKPIEPIK